MRNGAVRHVTYGVVRNSRGFGYAALAGLFYGVLSSMVLAEEHAGFDAALQASTTEIVIAQPLAVTVRAAAPPGWQIVTPPLPAELGDLRVIDSSDETQQTPSLVVWTRRLVLEGYAPGRKTISPLEINFQKPQVDGEPASEKPEPRTLHTDEAVIRVRSALGPFESEQELRPIDEAVAVPWTWRQWCMLAIGSGIAVGVGTRIVRWINHFHDDDGRLSPRLLLGELEGLREAWLRRTMSDGETVVATAEVARRWLRSRETDPVLHRATAAWALRLQDGDEAIGPIVEILRLADLVKFAHAEPTIDEVRQCLLHVRHALQPEQTS